MNESRSELIAKLREALHQDSGRCIADYEGALAALESLEEQVESERGRVVTYMAAKDETVRLLHQSEARAQGYKEQLQSAQDELRENDRLVERAWRERDEETEKAKRAEEQLSAPCRCDKCRDCVAAEWYERLQEQLEAAQRDRSEIAQRARSYFIDYEEDCPHPVAMFLDDVSVDPPANPASTPLPKQLSAATQSDGSSPAGSPNDREGNPNYPFRDDTWDEPDPAGSPPEEPSPWALVYAVERAYDHGNLDGDLLYAWLDYQREESRPAISPARSW